MAWKIEFDREVEKDLKKLGHTAQKRILRFLKEKISPVEDPRILGKALAGNFSGFWRYRVGDYRIIVKFEDAACVILVVLIGHRKSVYD